MQVNAGQLVNDGQQRKGVKVMSGQQGMGKKDMETPEMRPTKCGFNSTAQSLSAATFPLQN